MHKFKRYEAVIHNSRIRYFYRYFISMPHKCFVVDTKELCDENYMDHSSVANVEDVKPLPVDNESAISLLRRD